MRLFFLHGSVRHDELQAVTSDVRKRGVQLLSGFSLAVERQGRLTTCHRQIDFCQYLRIEQSAVKLSLRVVYLVTLRERIKIVSLARMHSPSERERIETATARPNVVRHAIDASEFMVDKRDIEVRVVNDEFGTIDEREELLGHIGEYRLVRQIPILDAMHLGCCDIYLSLGIDISLKHILGGAAVDEFDAADLNDAMTRRGIQSRGFRIKNNLSQPPDSRLFGETTLSRKDEESNRLTGDPIRRSLYWRVRQLARSRDDPNAL